MLRLWGFEMSASLPFVACLSSRLMCAHPMLCHPPTVAECTNTAMLEDAPTFSLWHILVEINIRQCDDTSITYTHAMLTHTESMPITHLGINYNEWSIVILKCRRIYTHSCAHGNVGGFNVAAAPELLNYLSPHHFVHSLIELSSAIWFVKFLAVLSHESKRARCRSPLLNC